MPADNRNEIGVRARRDTHPQNLPKNLSRKRLLKPEHQPEPVRETNMRTFQPPCCPFPPP
jgi:hypothetical protein